MKERPILFSAPMVRAILEGRKTQTRRVVKKVSADCIGFFDDGDGEWAQRYLDGHGNPHLKAWRDRCPYGQPGDRLWVKETWRTAKSLDAKSPAAIGEMCIDAGYRKPWAPMAYEADGHRNSEWRGFDLDGDAEPGKTRVSIHMPRWASRITLEVTGVRVERLQGISESDCWAEGIEEVMHDFYELSQCEMAKRLGCCIDDAKPLYAQLWEQINGYGSWGVNPWVWVIEFKKI